jgi:hypothetical protein
VDSHFFVEGETQDHQVDLGTWVLPAAVLDAADAPFEGPLLLLLVDHTLLVGLQEDVVGADLLVLDGGVVELNARQLEDCEVDQLGHPGFGVLLEGSHTEHLLLEEALGCGDWRVSVLLAKVTPLHFAEPFGVFGFLEAVGVPELRKPERVIVVDVDHIFEFDELVLTAGFSHGSFNPVAVVVGGVLIGCDVVFGEGGVHELHFLSFGEVGLVLALPRFRFF